MSDKRTVSTDALETLGTIHTRDEKRDAIHIAVLPVEAGEDLEPGDRVTVKDGVALETFDGQDVGIVDPFLKLGPEKGERFWLLLNPRTIQSLRHVWSHPAFPDEAGSTAEPNPDLNVVMAKAAVHELARDLGVSDENLMEGAKHWVESSGTWEGYMCFGEDLSYNWDMPKFWAAYTLLTGEDVPADKREAFFRCAC